MECGRRFMGAAQKGEFLRLFLPGPVMLERAIARVVIRLWPITQLRGFAALELPKEGCDLVGYT